MSEDYLLTVDNTADTFADLSDHSILSQVLPPTREPEDADDTSDDPPQPLPTRTEVDNALAILLRHAEDTNGMTCTDLDHLMKYHTV